MPIRSFLAFLRRAVSACALLSTVALLLCACGGNNHVRQSDACAPMENGGGSSAMRAIIDPASEVRGVYIATVFNIDYPSKADLSDAALKKELDAIIETVEDAGLNTIYFQVRPACDALYDSDIFPVSKSLSTKGKLTFDPLAYLVDAAHRKNIFVHAWINPLRVTLGSASNPATDPADLPNGHPVKEHPEWALPYADGRLYLDPGLPQVRTLIADGVREIVENYNVDGILFDDYFYPYPVTDENGVTAGFDDSVSYGLYGDGMTRADFRRDSVNQMIKLVYTTIKDVSTDVSFGVAPFGIWKNDDGKNGGSNTHGLESYSAIYCDPTAWAKDGYIDYIAPQIYWQFETSVAPFDELVRFWNRTLDGTGVSLYISHAAYSYDTWSAPSGEMTKQVLYAREALTYRGSIFYGYDEIARNAHAITDELRAVFADTIVYAEPSPTGTSVTVSDPPAGSYINGATVTVTGASTPDLSLSVNGTPVERTRGGYFTLTLQLQPGENTFVFRQGEERYTYILYRGTKP